VFKLFCTSITLWFEEPLYFNLGSLSSSTYCPSTKTSIYFSTSLFCKSLSNRNPVHTHRFLLGNFSLNFLASSVVPSILIGCIGSPPNIDKPSTCSFSHSFSTSFITSSVNSSPPIKSCVSGLKQFLQLNVHPCINIETLTPCPFE